MMYGSCEEFEGIVIPLHISTAVAAAVVLASFVYHTLFALLWCMAGGRCDCDASLLYCSFGVRWSCLMLRIGT